MSKLVNLGKVVSKAILNCNTDIKPSSRKEVLDALKELRNYVNDLIVVFKDEDTTIIIKKRKL